MTNLEKDNSSILGLGTAAATTAGNVTTVAALTGGTMSGPMVMYALGKIGAVVGGGMAAGLGIVIAGPALAGGAVWGACKIATKCKSNKQRKV